MIATSRIMLKGGFTGGFLSRPGERLNPAKATTRIGDQGTIAAGVGVQRAGHGGVDQLVAGVGQGIHVSRWMTACWPSSAPRQAGHALRQSRTRSGGGSGSQP